MHGTDRDWELLGQLDPFWAVVTDEAFRKSAMASEESLTAFLDSGRRYVDSIWRLIGERVHQRFAPRSALDFGCGAGRLAIPMAERCERVVGVDVAESMLAEARRLCAKLNVHNVAFAKGDDELTAVAGTFDLVHSFIVFQHIPPERGLRLLKRLAEKVHHDGVGVLHVLYHNPDLASRPARVVKTTWRHLVNRFRGRPQMQMNAYPLQEVFRVLHDAGVRQMHCAFTNHGGCLGTLLCFRKIDGAGYLA